MHNGAFYVIYYSWYGAHVHYSTGGKNLKDISISIMCDDTSSEVLGPSKLSSRTFFLLAHLEFIPSTKMIFSQSDLITAYMCFVTRALASRSELLAK